MKRRVAHGLGVQPAISIRQCLCRWQVSEVEKQVHTSHIPSCSVLILTPKLPQRLLYGVKTSPNTGLLNPVLVLLREGVAVVTKRAYNCADDFCPRARPAHCYSHVSLLFSGISGLIFYPILVTSSCQVIIFWDDKEGDVRDEFGETDKHPLWRLWMPPEASEFNPAT